MEARLRRQKTVARLEREGVPWNPHLPLIESVEETSVRDGQEVAVRAMALLVVAGKGEGISHNTIDDLIARYELDEAFSPNERDLLENEDPSKEELTEALWQYEAASTLLWALSYVPVLGRPIAAADPGEAIRVLVTRTRAQFIADVRMRSTSEILDECDLAYCYHWAVVQSQATGESAPGALLPNVTYQRHYALSWLGCFEDQEWDDVSTDT